MQDRIIVIADLLMGSAYADQHLTGQEKAQVRKLLREILGTSNLPLDLDFRIEEFDPKAFDLTKAAAAFSDDSPERLSISISWLRLRSSMITAARSRKRSSGRPMARPTLRR